MKSKLIILMIALISLLSCDEIFEITPQDKISETDVWNDASLIQLYINACYTNTFQHGLYRTNQIGHATDELHSIKGSVYYKIIQEGDLTPDNVGMIHSFLHNWSNAYSVIRDINIFFTKIDDAPIDENVKTGMKGEMMVIRAYLYSQLISRYGGVPIIENVFELNDEYEVERGSYDVCVSYIVTQLDQAIPLLPDGKQTGSDLGKLSADVARALKSRVLLYAASPLNNPSNDKTKWQKAANATAELLDAGYSLYNDYYELFQVDNEEIIFARYFTQSNSTQLSFQVGRCGDHGWGSDSPTQNLVNDFEMVSGQLPLNEDGTVNEASGYDPENPYADRDPRFYASILYDGSFWMGRETETFKGGLDSRDGPIDSWNGTLSGYYLKKFVPEDIPPVMGISDVPTNPYVFFRYGEILLNYAEANYMLGNEEIAREYLNKVRNRPGVEMPPVTASGEELLEKIRHERRIELVFEGHRFFDVRRWKIAGETESKDLKGVQIIKNDDGSKTYSLINLIDREWDDRLYMLPIPRAEIDRSNNSLVQNPGYN